MFGSKGWGNAGFQTIVGLAEGTSLTLDVYKMTHGFPDDERFGLTSQIRRAASSIPTNIAEGSGHGSNADFSRFLQIAFGSAKETEYLLILSKDLRYCPDETFAILNNNIKEVQKMLMGLMRKLQ